MNESNIEAVHSIGGYSVTLNVNECADGVSSSHSHDSPEMIIVFRGVVTVEVGIETVVLSRGQGIIIKTGAVHRLICSDSDVLTASVQFSEEIIAPSGSDIDMKYVKPLMSCQQSSFFLLDSSVIWQREILDMAGGIVSLLFRYGGGEGDIPSEFGGEDSPCWELDVHYRLCGIWRLLYSGFAGDIRSSVTGGEAVSQRRTAMMTDFIRRNYHSQISLAEISAAANISKSEASRCFQSCLNTSPVNYLLKYRAEMAAQMLKSTEMSIDSIGFECGFGSASYFCKMFHRYMGVTPGAYRKGRDKS